MDTNELKFLLNLLGCANYRSSLSTNIFKGFKGKDKICQDLGDRQLVDYTREIATVKILPPGQALLKDPTQVPIAAKELKVLEKIAQASGNIAPSKITSLKAAERNAIFTALGDRGLIVAEVKMKRTQGSIWLTQRGIEFLRDEYSPQGQANINLDLLNNYLRFLRQNLRIKPEQASSSLPLGENVASKTILNVSEPDILQIIQKLDKELNTENYLPIFHLRQKLQPPLSRDELDQVLYRLQRSDSIELSSLLDPTPYTTEQINAGISQNVGGSLFFVSVN
ncbi:MULTISPECIES: transcription factor RcaD [unclassified Nodularia (in: cyanobacteria)]|uniref:transcription factor RcaD n=1 Tax=unclassified Nodularia (in: cyanobacteria) TaxID=2656917 RepID=UPI00187F5E31|nr:MULTISPECIES: transcription factor RcaD [unclassified Nodularia (in: cyanobacteria)]MBE9200667.1 transcription factor RcaD [Nodularia sp. LEGE 06071]MCC2694802.1 transcription factor RcaD [Nodularia sp. LEGE 04288]